MNNASIDFAGISSGIEHTPPPGGSAGSEPSPHPVTTDFAKLPGSGPTPCGP